jgi:hypothetical protein
MADPRPDALDDLYGAAIRLATDEAPDASLERHRMMVALDAARALERAIREGVVAAGFATLRNEAADPLALELSFAIGRSRYQDPDVWPVFTFNLRDAYIGGTNDGANAHAINGVERLVPALESLLEQMRRNLSGVYRATPRGNRESTALET